MRARCVQIIPRCVGERDDSSIHSIRSTSPPPDSARIGEESLKPDETITMNAFATRFGTKLMAPAVAGAVSGLTLYHAPPAFGTTVHAATKPAVDLKAVRQDIADLIEGDAEKRGDGTSLTGTFVRLAWHCSGSYSKADGSGGSNGARMRFNPEANWGANAGLGVARDALEPLKDRHPEISYADLYTLAGVVAVEEAGGPTIPYRTGREDFESGESSPPDGRLPDADKGSMKMTAQHVRDVFFRMGFNDREIVALLGAHALGRCHTDRSGYWGPWTFAENTFSNEYFRLLLEERWSPKMTHNGKPWASPDQYEDSTGKLMMLPSDMVLVSDPEFKKYVMMYAKDEDLFFKDFAKAFAKLLELGVPFPSKKWFG